MRRRMVMVPTGLAPVLLAVTMTGPYSVAGRVDSPASVRTALLRCSDQDAQPALVLWTRGADADRRDRVVAYRHLGIDLSGLVYAKERRHGRWVITRDQPHARRLLGSLRDQLARHGEARFKAGVAARTETGGRLNYFSLTACDERTPPRARDR